MTDLGSRIYCRWLRSQLELQGAKPVGCFSTAGGIVYLQSSPIGCQCSARSEDDAQCYFGVPEAREPGPLC